MQLTKTSIRVFVGTAVLGIAHIPAVKHHRVNPDVVLSYLQGKATYNPYLSMRDWNTSENRKNEILRNINKIREQIRVQAQQLQNTDPEGKLIETIASTMMNASRNRQHHLTCKRASELRTLPKFINYPNLLKKLNIVQIELV